MKNDKNEKTPYIMRTTKHFNDVSSFGQNRCTWVFLGSIHLSLSPYQISNLIATEILRCEDVVTRVAVIEKWVAVADICRCLHNYNAVLEITSSLNRSSVFRLKKTWLKVSKQVCIRADQRFCFFTSLLLTVIQTTLFHQTKGLIDKLQKLVSSEGRFKNLREALKK